jgi:hypothetical protein
LASHRILRSYTSDESVKLAWNGRTTTPCPRSPRPIRPPTQSLPAQNRLGLHRARSDIDVSVNREVCTDAGRIDAALEALDRAAGAAAAMSEMFYQVELVRLRGMLLMTKGHSAAAEDWLPRSIEVAVSQGAKSLELRAATSLARLRRERARRNEAHDLLAPIYRWFTGGPRGCQAVPASLNLAGRLRYLSLSEWISAIKPPGDWTIAARRPATP